MSKPELIFAGITTFTAVTTTFLLIIRWISKISSKISVNSEKEENMEKQMDEYKEQCETQFAKLSKEMITLREENKQERRLIFSKLDSVTSNINSVAVTVASIDGYLKGKKEAQHD